MKEIAMKRNKGTKTRRQVIPMWTYNEVQKAQPYLTSILRSARDHQLEANRQDLLARRLAARPGRPDRALLIAHAEALRDGGLARERLVEALEELQSLGIECPDAVQGVALVPFVNEQQLAWLVYDMFDDEPLRSWRYQTDPEEMRRPLGELQAPVSALN